ncbi:TPA: hypothetical protein L3521_003248 [Escherichia coli]|nr:hypothetical protein [Escherichia coli]
MTTFTDKELIKEIKERIGSLDVRDNIERRAYEIALASLEAKPVAWTDDEELRDVKQYGFGEIFQCPPDKYADPRRVISLYREPPAVPAVLERLRAIVSDPRALPRRKEWVSGQQYSYVLLENVEAMVDEACHAAMLQGSQPVSQTYNLPELIEGMEVSIDVSTCDADLGNRYFGTVTEALELDTAKNGYILLVQDAEPNFDVNGNSPVTPDGWVMVPKKLTAENGAKGVLSGEFSETTFISCPECFGDDDCDTCDGSGRIEIKVPVTWTTIKSIWDKGIAHFAAKPPQEVNRG